MLLTKTRVEHEERHLIALLRSSNGNETLVAVVLRFVDLDDTSTELAYLVDLCTALSDDSADHVVGDKDLLSQRLAGHHALHGLLRRTGVRGTCCGRGRLSRVCSCVRSRSVGACADIWLSRRCSRVVNGCLRVHRGGCAAVRVLLLHTVASGRRAALCRRLAAEVIWRSPLSTSRLRNIRDHLHTSRHNTCRSAAACSVGRSCGASEALSQLLDKSTADIVCCDVDSICYTQNNERTLGG